MKGKILITSHDDDSCRLLLKLFSSEFLTVTCISDEADLFLETLEHDYNLIIYDTENSTLDSLKVIKILRKMRPKIALVVISNDPSKKLGGEFLQESVIYYDIKPFNPNALKGAVLQSLSN